MTLKKDIVFEVCAPKSKQVLIYGERKLGQIEIRANDAKKGDIEVGHIPDVWRENDNLQAQNRIIKKMLNLSDETDVVEGLQQFISKIDELAQDLGREFIKKEED